VEAELLLVGVAVGSTAAAADDDGNNNNTMISIQFSFSR
jgi:hypothetical protein